MQLQQALGSALNDERVLMGGGHADVQAVAPAAAAARAGS